MGGGEGEPKGGGIVAICTVALLGILGIAPVFGMAAAMNSDYCFENETMICSALGLRLMAIAPVCGAGTGLLIAVIGGCVPRLRRFRVRFLLAGYCLASVGFVVSFAIARSTH